MYTIFRGGSGHYKSYALDVKEGNFKQVLKLRNKKV